jgi:hypothetical protein
VRLPPAEPGVISLTCLRPPPLAALGVKKVRDLCDVGCCLGFRVNVFGAASIALFFGEAGALGVVDVTHLGLKQAAGRAVLVEGGTGRDGHVDKGDVAACGAWA